MGKSVPHSRYGSVTHQFHNIVKAEGRKVPRLYNVSCRKGVELRESLLDCRKQAVKESVSAENYEGSAVHIIVSPNERETGRRLVCTAYGEFRMVSAGDLRTNGTAMAEKGDWKCADNHGTAPPGHEAWPAMRPVLTTSSVFFLEMTAAI